MPLIYDGNKGVTFPDGSVQAAAASGIGFKNRVINGGMTINQRALGTFTPTNAGPNYSIDRWTNEVSQASKFTVQQSSTAPAGFTNSLLVTSSSAYSPTSNDYFTVEQRIEGYNMIDLAWGTTSAKTVTLSFWTQSSLTGTFGGAIGNTAGNYTYAFTYSIPVANTWTFVSVTIPGATSSTWLGTTSTFCYLYFSMGAAGSQVISPGSWLASGGITGTGSTNVVATNGATWYLTGVQLEVANSATPFGYRPYGAELSLCQRYFRFYQSYQWCGSGYIAANNSTTAYVVIPTGQLMRTTPTLTCPSPTTVTIPGGFIVSSFGTVYGDSAGSIGVAVTLQSGTAGQGIALYTNTTTISLSAEL